MTRTYINGRPARVSRYHKHECPSCGRRSMGCALDHRFHAVGEGGLWCSRPDCVGYAVELTEADLQR